MNPHVHRLAAAGNAAALLMVVLFAAVLARPFDVAERSAAPSLPSTATGTADRVVLVVIDGLRADAARDTNVMRFLCGLAATGGATTARVESLVPSSVAGVTTLATGVVPHPASFVHDFHAPPSSAGGLFEALAARGERSFVAGAALWSDLYGRWAETAYRAEGLADHDEAVLRAGLAALDAGPHRLAVFHFGRPDEAGHLRGATSAEYARAVAWCDDAIRQIAARLGPGTAIVVTSDHGLTDGGGHAGPEPEVVNTPLVMRGPGLPNAEIPPVRQRDVPALIARALGITLPSPPPPIAVPWLAKPAVWAPLVGLATLCTVAIASRLVAGASGRPEAFWMNAAVWVCVALFVFDRPPTAAVVLATGTLVLAAIFQRRRASGGSFLLPATALICGGTWAAARLASEWGGFVLTAPTAAFAVTLVVLAGLWVRSPRPTPGQGVLAGGVLAWTASLAAIIAGQSLSLSTLDVRAGYYAAQHGGGIPAAFAVVLLQQALPAAAVVLAASVGPRRLTSTAAGGLFVGLSIFPAGEALVFGSVLLCTNDTNVGSLALGGLLRAAAMLVFLTCGVAVVPLAKKRDPARPSVK